MPGQGNILNKCISRSFEGLQILNLISLALERPGILYNNLTQYFHTDSITHSCVLKCFILPTGAQISPINQNGTCMYILSHNLSQCAKSS